ncbi:hypothetical protein HKD37_02G005326 [Glycine soja]
MFMNYTPPYKKTWLAKQRAMKMIHGNWEESYAKLPKLLGALQSCIPETVVVAQTESVYAYTEKMHWRHLGDIDANKPSVAEWLDQLPKKNWVQCFDEGKHWRHMTINLFESVNSMFKNTRHLLVSSLVKETYFKTAQLFAIRGRQTQAMINSGSQDPIPTSNTQTTGRFRVILQSQKFDCGEYQAKHLPCSHVMTACKFVNVDPMNYVPTLFTLQHILNVYDNSFGLLPYESMWQKYEGDQWGPDPRRKRTAKDRPVSTRIPTEMDEDENERKNTKKNVEFSGNMILTETIVLTYLHLKFFIS